MKRIILSIALLLIILGNLTCSEENRVAAAIADGEELEDGTMVLFLLHENYPNPFNPSTVIKFTISKSMHIDLIVYSEDWIKVATLISVEMGLGAHEVNFNAEGLSSGEYFYTMTGEGVTQIRKMKLVK
jgi:hypothetical protein